MASILRRGGVALGLIILIVVSLSFEVVTVADGRTPSKHERQLATDCNSPVQREIPGCGGGSSSPSPRPRPRPRPSGPTPGSNHCKGGRCCGTNKNGLCVCC